MTWRFIQYREFYDVPRMVLAVDGDVHFLFVSHFDDSLDDYVDYYTVYRMPLLSDQVVSGPWTTLESLALGTVERIPLEKLPFTFGRIAGV